VGGIKLEQGVSAECLEDIGISFAGIGERPPHVRKRPGSNSKKKPSDLKEQKGSVSAGTELGFPLE